MSIPSQAGVQWAVAPISGNSKVYTVTFTAADQVTEPLEISDYSVATIHIFGTFNAQTVTVKGFNVNVAAATPLALHRADALTSTFSAVGADLLAKVVETPRYIVATTDGAVTSVTVAVMVTDKKNS